MMRGKLVVLCVLLSAAISLCVPVQRIDKNKRSKAERLLDFFGGLKMECELPPAMLQLLFHAMKVNFSTIIIMHCDHFFPFRHHRNMVMVLASLRTLLLLMEVASLPSIRKWTVRLPSMP